MGSEVRDAKKIRVLRNRRSCLIAQFKLHVNGSSGSTLVQVYTPSSAITPPSAATQNPGPLTRVVWRLEYDQVVDSSALLGRSRGHLSLPVLHGSRYHSSGKVLHLYSSVSPLKSTPCSLFFENPSVNALHSRTADWIMTKTP